MNRKLFEDLTNTISKHILNEMSNGSVVWTISALNITKDEPFLNRRYTNAYYNEQQAIDDANKFAREISEHWTDVVCVSVLTGAQMIDGDVVGDSYDVYTVSSKPEEETIEARKLAGFVRHDVDAYIQKDGKLVIQ